MFVNKIIHRVTLVCLPTALLVLASVSAFGQSTAFSYQGRLTEGSNPASGSYDLQFKLFDTATIGTGTQHGAILTLTNITVTASLFTVQLDFGSCPSCFNGGARFLEIAVKPTSGATFTTLGPRQPISATPYAIKSQSATTADGLSLACVSCVTSSQIQGVQGAQVTGTIPVASVPAGSTSYVQNGMAQQAATNFNIAGSGTANTFNAATQYQIGGLRMLVANGPHSGSLTLAASNIFLGESAGINTTPNPELSIRNGKFNSFFGANAGKANTTGYDNAFFGTPAGSANTTGFDNAFFGAFAGDSNTTGPGNSFFGTYAGSDNTTGGDNSMFGYEAGSNSSTGGSNSFFGKRAGLFNEDGSGNSFFGSNAGGSESSNNTTAIGFNATVGGNLTNATAIGARARVGQNNSLVLGSILGVNGCTVAANCDSVNVGIGTTTPGAKLTLSGTGDFNAPGAARLDLINTAAATSYLLHVTDAGLWQVATTAGASRLVINSTGNVGIGDTTPDDKLDVQGDIRVGTGTTGCVKDADASVIAGTCSSDVRLKRDITPFPQLLDQLVQLRPVHFYWRTEQFPDRHLGKSQSFGLVAQEVEQVMPELVTEDERGYKVVRYHKLPFLMLEAIKELKAENDALKQRLDEMSRQREKITEQQMQIEGLKKIICLDHPEANLCKSITVGALVESNKSTTSNSDSALSIKE